MDTIWIVKSYYENSTVYLTDYCGQSESDVYEKIAAKGRLEGTRGSGREIAARFGWHVIPVTISEKIASFRQAV